MNRFTEVKIKTKDFSYGYDNTIAVLYIEDINQGRTTITDYNYQYDESKPQYFRVKGTVEGFDRVKGSASDLMYTIFADIKQKRNGKTQTD